MGPTKSISGLALKALKSSSFIDTNMFANIPRDVPIPCWNIQHDIFSKCVHFCALCAFYVLKMFDTHQSKWSRDILLKQTFIVCSIIKRGHYRVSSALDVLIDCCNIENEFHFVFLLNFVQCVVSEVVLIQNCWFDVNDADRLKWIFW